ncbi:hypothetical protein DL765_000920 [Monosporascus sp. GIB2]|nr:hypothetical protein DL765_000920 [Monosporascus sp. GIB2]
MVNMEHFRYAGINGDLSEQLVPHSVAASEGFKGSMALPAARSAEFAWRYGMWSVLGAGQNFGIVIERTFETYSASNNGMHYNLDMTFTGESFETVIDTINSLAPEMDPALTIITLFTVDVESLRVMIALGLVLNRSIVLIETFGQEGVSALPNDHSAFPHRGEINNLIVLEMVYTDDTVAGVADDFGSWMARHIGSTRELWI